MTILASFRRSTSASTSASCFVPSPSRAAFAVLSAVLLLGAPGCSGEDPDAAPNGAPKIDSIEGPAAVSAVGGVYSLPFTLRFTDPDSDTIAKVRYRIPKASLDKTGDLPPQPKEAIGAQLIIIIRDGAPKETYDIVFSAFDSRGGESEAVTRQIKLE
jgi:hypothetical protein